MAKLEDLVTPSEILEMIKGGMLKTELIKRYRTSEQELALMLLPLHRGGELTKEEFNNFFKGIPLSQPEIPAPAVTAAPSHEPHDKPAEAIRSPQKIVGKKPANDLAEHREIAVQDGPEAVGAPQAEPIIRQSAASAPAAEVQKESASVTEALQTILGRLDSIDRHLSEIEKKLGFN